MPYLIEKSDGTRTLVQMTAEEANYRAGTMPVFEVAEDEVTIIGQVHVKPEAVVEPVSEQSEQVETTSETEQQASTEPEGAEQTSEQGQGA